MKVTSQFSKGLITMLVVIRAVDSHAEVICYAELRRHTYMVRGCDGPYC